MNLMTRQRKWQIKMKKAGRCTQCGKQREQYASHCNACQVKYNAHQLRQYHRTHNNVHT